MKTYHDGSISKCRKTLKSGLHMEVDEKVKEWVELMRARGLELSQEDIITKANVILSEKCQNQSLSSGWFQGFMKRYNIQRRNFYGEAKSVNQLVVDNWTSHLNEILKLWDPKDVYNAADETGLYYQLRRGFLIKLTSLIFFRSRLCAFS